MGGDRILELRPDRQDWVERVHRALHDERVIAPADFAQRLLIHREQIATLEPHAAADHLRRRAEETRDGEEQGGLAAARFAHDADEFAGGDLERDLVHGPDRAAVGRIFHAQVADLEQWLGRDHRRRRTGRRAGLVISSNA